MMAFDSLTFAQELEKVGVPTDQAQLLASLIRDQVLASVVTKVDLAHTEQRLDERIDRLEERLKAEMAQLEQRMTIKLGAMVVVAVGLIVTAQKLL